MIKPDEIDPTIQSALKERMAQIFAQNVALDPLATRVKASGLKAWRDTAKQYTRQYWTAATLFGASILSTPILAPLNEGLWVLALLGLTAASVGLVVNINRKIRDELTRYVSPDLLRGAAHLVALSRAEQSYCEAVAALAEAGDILGEVTQKELLAQLNDLLASYRKLEEPLKQYRAASGGQSVEDLERELAELGQRRDTQSDSIARSTMEQSMALCAQRLEHGRRVEPIREQAEAHQEYLVQTLASIQASLARICGSGMAPLPAEVAGIRDSVRQVHHQTSAVEDAVAEVLALRAGA